MYRYTDIHLYIKNYRYICRSIGNHIYKCTTTYIYKSTKLPIHTYKYTYINV